MAPILPGYPPWRVLLVITIHYGRTNIIKPYLILRQIVGVGSMALSQPFRRLTGRTREAPEIQR